MKNISFESAKQKVDETIGHIFNAIDPLIEEMAKQLNIEAEYAIKDKDNTAFANNVSALCSLVNIRTQGQEYLLSHHVWSGWEEPPRQDETGAE